MKLHVKKREASSIGPTFGACPLLEEFLGLLRMKMMKDCFDDSNLKLSTVRIKMF
jgi:hypothetical protein